MNEKTFDIKYTNIAKGIAIIMMLIHHLFYNQSIYNEISLFSWDGFHYGIWSILSTLTKTCVTIFAFLSAYGLYKSFSKNTNLKDFYIHRFKKLYTEYWFIWLFFVPLAIKKGRSLTLIYGSNYMSGLLQNIFGIYALRGGGHVHGGFNGSWWFISLIIIFYILFPIFYKISKNSKLLIFLFVASLNLYFLGYNYSRSFLYYYIPIFLLGIIFSKFNLFEKLEKFTVENSKYLLILFFNLLILRLMLVHNICYGYPSFVDLPISLIIILFLFSFKLHKNIYKILETFGKYSMDIYLFHVFLMIDFAKNIYITKNPLLLIVYFSSICLIIAIIINYLKNIITNLINRIAKIIPFLHSQY